MARFGREVLARMAVFRSELSGADPAQPVVLAAGAGAYRYLLGPPIRAFTTSGVAPLSLVTADRAGALTALRDGIAHIAVSAMEAIDDDLEAHRIATVPQVVVAPIDHPIARAARTAGRTTAPLSALDGARLVVPPPDRPHRRALERALRAAGVTWHVAVVATGWDLMLHFVRVGLGLAVVNGFCAAPPGTLAVELPDLPALDYFAIRARTARLPPAAVRLLSDIRTHVGSDT